MTIQVFAPGQWVWDCLNCKKTINSRLGDKPVCDCQYPALVPDCDNAPTEEVTVSATGGHEARVLWCVSKFGGSAMGFNQTCIAWVPPLRHFSGWQRALRFGHTSENALVRDGYFYVVLRNNIGSLVGLNILIADLDPEYITIMKVSPLSDVGGILDKAGWLRIKQDGRFTFGIPEGQPVYILDQEMGGHIRAAQEGACLSTKNETGENWINPDYVQKYALGIWMDGTWQASKLPLSPEAWPVRTPARSDP